jgi:putative aldouronate transport system permease protein
VLVSAFVGYLFTKQKMFARKFAYRFVIVTMFFNAGLIPWYMNMRMLGMLNNYLAYILPAMVQPFYIILAKTYVESIPPSLEETAEMDGAGTLRVFWSILLPLLKPITATIAVFSAVGHWNSFTDTLYLMTDQKYFTLQYLLYRFLNEARSLAAIMRSGTASMPSASTALTPRTIQMTVTMVVVLPILFVYPFMQKYFVKGIMIGAIKG